MIILWKLLLPSSRISFLAKSLTCVTSEKASTPAMTRCHRFDDTRAISGLNPQPIPMMKMFLLFLDIAVLLLEA
jgi:hypothetical protein